MNIIDKVRSRFSKPPEWSLPENVVETLRNDPRIAAATIAYVGPGGCGKTRAALDNALTCGFVYGLPVYVVDANRELPKARDAFVEYYSDKPEVMAFLDRRVITGDSTELFQGCLNGIKKRNPHGVKAPQAVWVCDEGLLFREQGDESITALSLQARNNGVVFHLAGQRLKVAHPSTAETMRAVVAWGGGSNPPLEVFGVKLDRSELPQPRSDELLFVVGATGNKVRYNSREERALTLVAPVFPSKTPPRGFLARLVDK